MVKKNFHAPTAETRKSIADFGAVGVPHAECARFLGISRRTFVKHYGNIYEKSFVNANAAVSASLYNQAQRGNVAACIWWEKTRQNRSEKQIVEGNTDLPVVHAHVPVTDRETVRRIAYTLAAGLQREELTDDD